MTRFAYLRFKRLPMFWLLVDSCNKSIVAQLLLDVTYIHVRVVLANWSFKLQFLTFSEVFYELYSLGLPLLAPQETLLPLFFMQRYGQDGHVAHQRPGKVGKLEVSQQFGCEDWLQVEDQWSPVDLQWFPVISTRKNRISIDLVLFTLLWNICSSFNLGWNLRRSGAAWGCWHQGSLNELRWWAMFSDMARLPHLLVWSSGIWVVDFLVTLE